jgi:hypothetical protein
LKTDRKTVCRKSLKSESSKALEQQPTGKQIVSSVATASVPLLVVVVGACLVIYSNAEAKHSTRWVLQYLESQKDAEADREGNRSFFTAPSF